MNALYILQIMSDTQLAQIVDIEMSHLIWAGVVGIVGFFLKRELKKIDDHISSFEIKVKEVDDKCNDNTVDLAKVKTKLDIE